MRSIPVVTTETVPGKPDGFFVDTVMASKTVIHHIGQSLNAFPQAFSEAVKALSLEAGSIGADAVVGLRVSSARHPGDSVAGMKDDTIVLLGTAISYEEHPQEELTARGIEFEAERERHEQSLAPQLPENEEQSESKSFTGEPIVLAEGTCDCKVMKRIFFGTSETYEGVEYCLWCVRKVRD